jgi:Ca2+-binding RTX toxin-like protein
MLWTKTRTGFRTPKSSLDVVPLEDRTTPAVTALYSTGLLAVTGDGAANNIVVSADTTGKLTVTNNGQNVAIRSILGTPTVAGLAQVTVDARGGDDSITLTKSLNTLDGNGKLAASPSAVLIGGGGNDTLTPLIGGFVGGVVGNAIVGNVVQMGGSGNDTLVSGFGNDIMLGEGGNDKLVWNPGTLIDHYDGGDGFDNGVVIGNETPIAGSNADAFVLGKDPNNPGGVLFQRTNLVPFFITMVATEQVTMQTQGGDDTITVNDLSGTAVRQVVADGGTGNDTITGVAQTAAAVALVFNGGEGNDSLAGGAGRDVLNGGNGDDTIDISNNDRRQDIVVGGAGKDTVVVTSMTQTTDLFLDFEAQLDEVWAGT